MQNDAQSEGQEVSGTSYLGVNFLSDLNFLLRNMVFSVNQRAPPTYFLKQKVMRLDLG